MGWCWGLLGLMEARKANTVLGEKEPFILNQGKAMGVKERSGSS